MCDALVEGGTPASNCCSCLSSHSTLSDWLTLNESFIARVSVFDVAYLQTRSFGTNECALRRHRDGHLDLASDRADTHLQKTPVLRYLNGFGLLPKSNRAPVWSRHITATSP